MKRYFWTTKELALIREHYPAGGINACEPHLPGRTRTSIYQRAGVLGLRSPLQKVQVRQHWPNDEHLDQQIRFAHQQAPTRGSVANLAERIGRPPWWVSKRARELGLITPRFRDPTWSEAELAIVAATEQFRPEATQRRLRAAGFERTISAVVVRRKRMGIRVPEPVGEYSAAQVAKLLGYEPAIGSRWVRLGLLGASKDCDEHRITDAQLRRFIAEHPLQVDLRKLPLGNRPWFIELLTGIEPCSVTKATAA